MFPESGLKSKKKLFWRLKKAVSTSPVFKFFTPTAPAEGEGHASEKGISFVLMQQGQPVTHAIGALTKAEPNYSKIEKELLTQVYGMEKNHQYVYGRKITLWTETSCHCSKTSYVEANAVWCWNRVQAWPRAVSCHTLSRAYPPLEQERQIKR